MTTLRYTRPALAATLAATLARCSSATPGVDAAAGVDAVTPADAPAADTLAPADAPAGDGSTPACTDAPAGVQLTVINTVPATATAPAVTAYRVSYASTGGVRVYGQICVPQSPGRHPIFVYNHGGFEGLGVAEWSARPAAGAAAANQCYSVASGGSIAVAAQYRGEADDVGGVVGRIQSDGQIEVCAGEVDDVLALLEVARRRCDADPQRVVMWGASHGGCITLQALRRRPPGVRAGLALVPPTDFAPLYRYHVAHAPGGGAGPDGCDPVAIHQALANVLATAVGTPVSNAAGYASRSIAAPATELAGVALMVAYGVTDCLVPMAQGCSFHAALRAAGPPPVSYHLDATGQPTTAPLPGCDGITFQPGAWPGAQGFRGEQYFLALDGQGHGFTGVSATRAYEAGLAFLAAHL